MHGFLVDNYPGTNYSVGQLSGGQLSGGSYPEGHYLGGDNYPGITALEPTQANLKLNWLNICHS